MEILSAWKERGQYWGRVVVVGGSIVIRIIEGYSDKIIVHHYLLMQVTRWDALAAGTSVHALALEWGMSAQRALYSVAAPPAHFGP